MADVPPPPPMDDDSVLVPPSTENSVAPPPLSESLEPTVTEMTATDSATFENTSAKHNDETEEERELRLYGPQPGFVSKFVDLNTMPKESLLRVAELSKRRRERSAAADTAWLEMQQHEEAAFDAVRGELQNMEDEENGYRRVILTEENRLWERILYDWDEHKDLFATHMERVRRVRELEHLRDKRVNKLQEELCQVRFSAFSSQLRAETELKDEERKREKQRVRQMNELTTKLRKSYNANIPVFACDPEAAWNRGLAVPPGLQDTSSPKRTTVAPYQTFAQRLRDRYDMFCNHRATAFYPELEGGGSLSPASPGQPNSPAAAQSPLRKMRQSDAASMSPHVRNISSGGLVGRI